MYLSLCALSMVVQRRQSQPAAPAIDKPVGIASVAQVLIQVSIKVPNFEGRDQ
jgi:hypothetical protein